jgi:hypothetical protein
MDYLEAFGNGCSAGEWFTECYCVSPSDGLASSSSWLGMVFDSLQCWSKIQQPRKIIFSDKVIKNYIKHRIFATQEAAKQAYIIAQSISVKLDVSSI